MYPLDRNKNADELFTPVANKLYIVFMKKSFFYHLYSFIDSKLKIVLG